MEMVWNLFSWLLHQKPADLDLLVYIGAYIVIRDLLDHENLDVAEVYIYIHVLYT